MHWYLGMGANHFLLGGRCPGCCRCVRFGGRCKRCRSIGRELASGFVVSTPLPPPRKWLLLLSCAGWRGIRALPVVVAAAGSSLWLATADEAPPLPCWLRRTVQALPVDWAGVAQVVAGVSALVDGLPHCRPIRAAGPVAFIDSCLPASLSLEQTYQNGICGKQPRLALLVSPAAQNKPIRARFYLAGVRGWKWTNLRRRPICAAGLAAFSYPPSMDGFLA